MNNRGMNRQSRKTNPKVVDGRVQRKNRHIETPNYYNTPQDIPVIDRRRPGAGYRHVLRKRHIVDFVSILPEWEELSKGLDAVVLAPGESQTDGWYDLGIIGICAWEQELWRQVPPWYFEDHRDIFERIGVPFSGTKNSRVCRFTESTARAFQLVHIFLHELGHHHDRMTTRSKRASSRGEGYAERYAITYEQIIWNRYLEVIGLD